MLMGITKVFDAEEPFQDLMWDIKFIPVLQAHRDSFCTNQVPASIMQSRPYGLRVFDTPLVISNTSETRNNHHNAWTPQRMDTHHHNVETHARQMHKRKHGQHI